MSNWSDIAWHRAVSLEAAIAEAPESTGVYGFCKVSRRAELPTSIGWVYIGSSKNLKKRLGQHHPIAETHEAFRDWILKNRSNLEVWYCVVRGGVHTQLERYLVKALQPEFNRIQYKMGDA